MKKILIAFAVSMLVFACGGEEPAPVDTTVANPGGQCWNGAPDWVITGGIEGELTAVGAARSSKSGMSFMITQAMSDARNQMASSISVKVNNMVKSFTQSTGIGDDEVVDAVSANVSKQITSETLNGTTRKALWESPCGELYVMIGIDNELVKQEVKNSVSSSYQNEQALWQQFQAQKAQDELDAALEANF
jgi:hypothetical protein